MSPPMPKSQFVDPKEARKPGFVEFDPIPINQYDRSMADELEITNAMFRDSMPKDQMPSLWSICDVALVHLKDDPVFSTVIPSKIFEAFGMGKPVMMVLPDGEAAHIVREAGAGDWVPPENPRALVDKVVEWHADRALVERLGESAAAAAE